MTGFEGDDFYRDGPWRPNEMSYYDCDAEKLHAMITHTATKLVGNDIVNEGDNSRYQYKKKDPKDNKFYVYIDHELAVQDAAEIVMAALRKAVELEPEAAAETAEEEEETTTVTAENADDDESHIDVEAQPCESAKSSSPTSASTKPSNRTLVPG